MKPENKAFVNSLSRRAASVFAVFCAVVAVLLMSDYLRARSALPEAEAELEKMRAAITADPSDRALAGKFAALEAVYRGAVLAESGRSETGAALLLAGFGLLLASSAVYAQTCERKPGIPDRGAGRARHAAAGRFRAALAVSAAVCACAAAGYLVLGSSAPPAAPGDVEGRAAYATAEFLDSEWTSFRGPRNDGISRAASLPKSPKFELAWKADIPAEGFNSPVCAGGRVFVAGAGDAGREIFCFSQKDGSLLWRAGVSSPAKKNYDDQSGPSPSTMAVDGERAYAIFPTGELVCADMSGKVLYVKNFGPPGILYAYASSLLVCGRELIVQMDLENSRTIYALDSATGREIWRRENGAAVSWSTPSVAESGGRRVLTAATCSGVEAFDLETGKPLWSAACLSGEMATSATFGGGMAFVANDNSAAVALRLSDGSQAWSTDEIILPGVSSPVFADGELYVFTSGGTVSRVDAATGKLIGEYENENGFYSSPVFADGRIIACDTAGRMFVFEKGSDMDFSKPAYDFADTLYATPALSGGGLFVRAGGALYRLDIAEGGK